MDDNFTWRPIEHHIPNRLKVENLRRCVVESYTPHRTHRFGALEGFYNLVGVVLGSTSQKLDNALAEAQHICHDTQPVATLDRWRLASGREVDDRVGAAVESSSTQPFEKGVEA